MSGRNTVGEELLADTVNPLGFEEDNRVGSVKSAGHKTLCIGRSCREYDLQSRDVSGKSRPVLRMLCAVLGADGNTEDDRHLEDTGAHCLPLSHLVEDLVACAADEVSVHKLDDSAAAAHCVADSRTDDSRLGDRGVEESVIRNSLGHLLVDTECAAPVTVVLTVGDECGIVIELVDDRLEETVADVVHLHLGDGLAVCVGCLSDLSGDVLDSRALLLGHEHFSLS